MLRLGTRLAALLLLGPILLGLSVVLVTSFGYLPALGGERVSLDPWRELFAQPGLARSVAISLIAGLATPLVALLLTCLFLAGATGSRAYRVMRRAVSPLLAAPHAATAFGLAFLLAPSGWLARLASPWATGWERPPDLLTTQDPWGLAMMLGLVVKEAPFLLLVSLPALAQIGAPERLRMARGLGYRPAAAWLKTVLPGLYPLIRLPVYAVIAYASSAVDMALILGPSAPPPLSVAVLRWANDPDLSLRFMAAAGAVLQLGVTLLALAIWRLGERVVAGVARGWLTNGARGGGDRALSALGAAAMLSVAALAGLGLLGMALASVAGSWRFPEPWPETLSSKAWARAWPSVADATMTTLALGALASAAALVLAVLALENARRRGGPSDAGMLILYAPLLTPQIAFLFGLLAAFEALGLRPGFWTAALGHLVFVLPYALLSLTEPYRRLDPRWEQAARSLGASQTRAFWRVRAPMLLAPALVALAVGFAVSVGLYLPTQLLAAGRASTLATEAVALAAGGDRRVIGVWAVAQAAPPAIGFALAIMLPRLIWRDRRLMREA